MIAGEKRNCYENVLWSRMGASNEERRGYFESVGEEDQTYRSFLFAFGLKAPAATSGSTLPITKRRVSRPRADVNISKSNRAGCRRRIFGRVGQGSGQERAGHSAFQKDQAAQGQDGPDHVLADPLGLRLCPVL